MPPAFAGTGTPIPIPTEVLGPENIERIVELIRWETGGVFDLEFSLDGTMLAIATSEGIEVRSISGDADGTRDGRRVLDGQKESAVSFTNEGKIIAASWNMESMSLWKEDNNSSLRKIASQDMYLRSLAFSWDRRLFAAGDHSGNVTIWDLQSGKIIKKLAGFGYWVDSIAFSPDGQQLAIAYAYSRFNPMGDDWEFGVVGIINLATAGFRNLVTESLSSIQEIAYSTDGRLLTTQINNDLIIFSAQTGKALVALQGYKGGWLSNIKFSPDDRLLATSPREIDQWMNESIPITQFWDVETALVIGRLVSEGDYFSEVEFSPDGKFIAAGVHSGTVSLWGVLPTRE